MTAILKLRRATFILAGAMLLASSVSAPGAEPPDELEVALDLATMLQSARSVIAENQTLINDAAVGDKGLSGSAVQVRALEKFRNAKGAGTSDISTISRHGRLLKAQMDAIRTVMDDNQSTINQKGVGFKGFVPAVFARLVNEAFRRTMGDEAEIKVTAPPDLVRNRKARPDAWETGAIHDELSSPDWKTGAVFSATTDVPVLLGTSTAVGTRFAYSCRSTIARDVWPAMASQKANSTSPAIPRRVASLVISAVLSA